MHCLAGIDTDEGVDEDLQIALKESWDLGAKVENSELVL